MTKPSKPSEEEVENFYKGIMEHFDLKSEIKHFLQQQQDDLVFGGVLMYAENPSEKNMKSIQDELKLLQDDIHNQEPIKLEPHKSFYDKALDMFYPLANLESEEPIRLWGGYAKFFQPHIPSRIGSKLVSNIKDGLSQRNTQPLQDTITFLTTAHKKYLSQQGNGQIDVMCIPTPEAILASKILKEVIKEFNRETKGQ